MMYGEMTGSLRDGRRKKVVSLHCDRIGEECMAWLIYSIVRQNALE